MGLLSAISGRSQLADSGQKQTLEGIYKIRASHSARLNIPEMLCTLSGRCSSRLVHQTTRSGSPMLFNRALYWTASEAYILSKT